MSDLPPLPKATAWVKDTSLRMLAQDETTIFAYPHDYLIRPALPLFTADQMREYGRACERAAYERAIAAAEHNASLYPAGGTGWESSVECAQAIRAIKNLSALGADK